MASCRANINKLESDNSVSYLAAVALSEFFGGPPNGYSLRKINRGTSEHFWVVNGAGVILDPTENGAKPSYRFGEKVAKRNTVKKHLPLLEAMRAELLQDEEQGTRIPVDIFGRALTVQKDAALSDGQKKKLDAAHLALIADWASRPEEFIRSYFSKGAMALHFVRALIYGDEVPRTATMAYTWDRYYVAGSAYPFNEMLPKALVDPRILRGILFCLGGDYTFSKLISSNMPIGGFRMPFDFPISLARRLIDQYCPAGGAVLDPCHGWGGRLIGFMLSKAGRYVGVDPAPHSYKLQEMFDDLEQYLFEPKSIRLINKPFEDTLLKEAAYDFALTSPPYYNTEKYQGDLSSWRRYSTLDKWVEGFYKPMIVGISEALKPGAFFALQVTPKLKMPEIAREIGQEIGFEYVKVVDTQMSRYNSASADRAGSTAAFEVVVVFRKL